MKTGQWGQESGGANSSTLADKAETQGSSGAYGEGCDYIGELSKDMENNTKQPWSWRERGSRLY